MTSSLGTRPVGRSFGPNLIEELFNVKRFGEIKEREEGPDVKGDFEGSVAASWVKLGTNGAGIVSYNKKEYTTRPTGFTSIAPGTSVMLTHANGVYYSNW
jgi:hypothetical protein